jgi:hypothetical protein
MKVIMKNLKRMWLALTMSCIVSAGVFAQDQKNGQKPPPKENPPKVEVAPQKNPPSQRNDGGKKGGDDNKRGKP